MVDQESQPTDRHDQELHSECVVVPVIGGLEFQVDQVHGGVRTANVDDLKDADDNRIHTEYNSSTFKAFQNS